MIKDRDTTIKIQLGGLLARRGLAARVAGLVLGLSAVALAASGQALAAKSAGEATGAVYERVHYGSGARQVTDIYASNTPLATTVILVHGGGWRVYAPLLDYAHEARELQQHGFTVFVINYDQDSPAHPAFPLEPDDVMLATQWAIAHAAQYDANPSNVVLLGGSAGGNLVALAAEQLDATTPGTVRAVVSLSGPMNFAPLVADVEDGQITDQNFIYALNQALGGSGKWGPFSPSYETRWSPVSNIPAAAACPAWLLFNSEEELIPLSQAVEMRTDLEQAGCAVTLEVVPGGDHAFEYWKRVSSTVSSFIGAE